MRSRNALGQRVRKASSLGDTVFYYYTKGHLIAETGTPESGSTCERFRDHAERETSSRRGSGATSRSCSRPRRG